MLNQPNARFWLLLKHSLQLHSGWVKTLLLPLIKDNDMIMTLISFVWECKKCYVLGNKGCWTRWQIPWKPLGECCLSVDFCLLPGMTVSVLEQRTNEVQAISSIDQEHFHQICWAVIVDVYPTVLLHGLCHPQVAKRVIPSHFTDQLKSRAYLLLSIYTLVLQNT